jgi:SnoaL-like domain/Rho termination factor, N-terminal domain
MNKSELESKHIAELHELAAAAGIERYRMLTKAELIEKLAGGTPEPERREPPKQAQPERPERPKRKRRRRWGRRRKRGGIREHADRWLGAWNAHDLEEIVACYSEGVEFVLPALVDDSEERRIAGREALREHFRHGLELAPNLTVTEESLLVGPGGFAILYRREDGHRAIEAVELDNDGLAAKVQVFYERH